MGALAAVFSKSHVDAPSLVVKMLRAMQHRALDGAAVAWNSNLQSAPSPSSIAASSPTEHAAVGYGFTKILPGDAMQPIRMGEGWLCLEGRIVAHRTLIGGEEAARLLDGKLTSGGFRPLGLQVEGAYALCFCTHEGLLVTRDALGLKPVFVGSHNGLVAVASDRKALWTIGIHETRTLPPGGHLKVSLQEPIVEPQDTSSGKVAESSYRGVGVDELLRLLTESVSVQTAGLDRIAEGFSGGLDSTILAKIAKNAGVDLLLVTVGVGSTHEVSMAESTARAIELPIVSKQFSKDDVQECLDRILWLIEEPNMMKVGVAMAIHWTAKTALENNRPVLILGQGSDELFGGYRRFATILGERGPEASEEAILESIRCAHEVNYQRDEQAVSPLRVELRLPFATKGMVEFASRLPLTMKVRSPSDNCRKWVLREAAAKLGIPPAIAMRPKKAIQHASGVEKAIKEIAKRQQLTPSAYLEERFRMIKNNLADN